MPKLWIDSQNQQSVVAVSPAPAAVTGWRTVPEKFWAWAAGQKTFAWGAGLVLLAAIALVSAAGAAKNVSGSKLTGLSYGLCIATLATAAYLLGLTLRESGSKLSSLVVGADRRTSTSKVQLLLWTVGVAFALAYISSRTILGAGTFVCDKNTPQTNCVPTGDVWQQYLILLGVPAAAAVIAKGTTTYKVANGLIQKSDAEQAKGADIATDDNGRADLADVQYFVFNVIAFVYFFAHFLREGTFVAVPSLLLGLTSTAAATYTLNKALQTAKPLVSTVVPSHIRPGASVIVTGQNLFPVDGEATVKIGGAAVPLVRTSTAGASTDAARFDAPVNLPDGAQVLTVVTKGAVETDGYTVICEAPKVLGWSEEPAKHGAPAHLRLSALPDDDVPAFTVTVGAVALPAQRDPARPDTLTFTIPATIAAGDYDVTVSANGFEYSPTQRLHVK